MGCNDPPAAPGGGGFRRSARPDAGPVNSGQDAAAAYQGSAGGQGSHFTTSNAPLPATPVSSVYTLTFTFKLPSDLLPFRTERILRTTDYAGKNSNHSSSYHYYYYHIITMGKL